MSPVEAMKSLLAAKKRDNIESLQPFTSAHKSYMLSLLVSHGYLQKLETIGTTKLGGAVYSFTKEGKKLAALCLL